MNKRNKIIEIIDYFHNIKVSFNHNYKHRVYPLNFSKDNYRNKVKYSPIDVYSYIIAPQGYNYHK